MPAKVIQVIEVKILRGDGKDTILRGVTEYYSLDGEFLAESDPCPGDEALVKNLADND